LRARGAVSAGTRVVGIAPSHNVDAATVAVAAAEVGARVAEDGDLVGGAERGRRVLVIGGARSGKSAFAERLVDGDTSVTYVATAPDRPDDAEWVARVARHRARRPAAWTTVESPDVAAALRAVTGTVLVDCFSLWLATALDGVGAWQPDADADAAAAALDARVREVVGAWQATAARVVGVSSEVGLGVVPATPAGRRYRDELGRLNALLAAAADEVWLVTAGLPRRLK
jgi:adenosylcobinamide kinase/adenosylcobinamide-phosphate guanylyltransferase